MAWFGPCSDSCSCDGGGSLQCDACPDTPLAYLTRTNVRHLTFPNNIKAYNASASPNVEYDLSGFLQLSSPEWSVVRNANCSWPLMDFDLQVTGQITTYGTPFPTVDFGPWTLRVYWNEVYWRAVLLRPFPVEDWFELRIPATEPPNPYATEFAKCLSNTPFVTSWDFTNGGSFPAGSSFSVTTTMTHETFSP